MELIAGFNALPVVGAMVGYVASGVMPLDRMANPKRNIHTIDLGNRRLILESGQRMGLVNLSSFSHTHDIIVFVPEVKRKNALCYFKLTVCMSLESSIDSLNRLFAHGHPDSEFLYYVGENYEIYNYDDECAYMYTPNGLLHHHEIKVIRIQKEGHDYPEKPPVAATKRTK